MQSMKMSVKTVSLATAAGALAIMGAVTLASNPAHPTGEGHAAVIADTETQSTAPSSPAVPSAAPQVKATKFVGGDWPGM